jgi:hypothetical protein
MYKINIENILICIGMECRIKRKTLKKFKEEKSIMGTVMLESQLETLKYQLKRIIREVKWQRKEDKRGKR